MCKSTLWCLLVRGLLAVTDSRITISKHYRKTKNTKHKNLKFRYCTVSAPYKTYSSTTIECVLISTKNSSQANKHSVWDSMQQLATENKPWVKSLVSNRQALWFSYIWSYLSQSQCAPVCLRQWTGWEPSNMVVGLQIRRYFFQCCLPSSH